MSSHGSAPLATSAASGSNSGDDRHDPKGKRVREETRGCSVEKELRRLKIDRLKVEFCEKTWKPILNYGKMFLNILAKTVRDTIPASTLAWKDVKKEDIELILNQIEIKFDYPRSDALFMDSIEQSMMTYLRDWREMGSSTMIRQMKAKGNPETRELMSPIDYFKNCHLKPFGLRNEYTQEKYARIHCVEMVTSRTEALTQTQSQRVGSTLSAASTGQVAETITTLKQQLAEKNTEHTRQIDETQRQMTEKKVENQLRLKETQRQLNEQNQMLQTLIAKLGIKMPPPLPPEL
ncbi:hypothetical protein PanWU01x14_326080 [Parasponia andersonii]|uniref:Uncharacterized protein n=1 Tax=Parasponia andersonii TaxID=3476 RepID=A0A2P5AJL4_PARAD|nr:hypothetical protein PanWU01x14_326080 [Parasponia andersonii]